MTEQLPKHWKFDSKFENSMTRFDGVHAEKRIDQWGVWLPFAELPEITYPAAATTPARVAASIDIILPMELAE